MRFIYYLRESVSLQGLECIKKEKLSGLINKLVTANIMLGNTPSNTSLSFDFVSTSIILVRIKIIYNLWPYLYV